VGPSGHSRQRVLVLGDGSVAQGRDRCPDPDARPVRPWESGMSEQNPAAESPKEPVTGPVLGIFAHPDDAEISAGGTLARWVSEGREVHLLILTNGDRGSDDPSLDRTDLARTRRKETAAAAE